MTYSPNSRGIDFMMKFKAGLKGLAIDALPVYEDYQMTKSDLNFKRSSEDEDAIVPQIIKLHELLSPLFKEFLPK
jgi:hypothetical protein